MCPDAVIRRFAGVFVLLTLLLGYFSDHLWYLGTGFVGLNLLQSSFTNFCPLERVLGAARLAGCRPR